MGSTSMKKRSFSVPEDILLQELWPKLPVKSLIRFQSVSKIWFSLISQHSSLIAAKHSVVEEPVNIMVVCDNALDEKRDRIFFLDQGESNPVEIDTSYLWKKNDPDRIVSCFNLVGSCYGLVCLQLCYSDQNRALILWNPATRKVNYLPAVAVSPGYYEWKAAYALGLDNRGYHKVVRLEEVKTENKLWTKVKTQVFLTKSTRWRESGSLMKRSDTIIRWEEGLTVEGVVYWVTRPIVNPFNQSLYSFTVMSFDLSSEEFLELEGPPLEGDTRFYSLRLVKWRGSHGAIWVRANRVDIVQSQFWLKNKMSVGWTKMWTMDPSLHPLTSSRLSWDGMPLSYAKNESLYLLPTLEGTRVEGGPPKSLYLCRVCHHFHSLISPN